MITYSTSAVLLALNAISKDRLLGIKASFVRDGIDSYYMNSEKIYFSVRVHNFEPKPTEVVIYMSQIDIGTANLIAHDLERKLLENINIRIAVDS